MTIYAAYSDFKTNSNHLDKADECMIDCAPQKYSYDYVNKKCTCVDIVDDENNDDSDNIGDLFKKVKINDSLTCNLPMEVPYYSSGLFENICFQCGNIPEENDESINSVSIDDGYYYYCNECNSSVSDKRKRSKDAKLQQNKKKRI
jgi:hypothetical protein